MTYYIVKYPLLCSSRADFQLNFPFIGPMHFQCHHVVSNNLLDVRQVNNNLDFPFRPVA